MEFDSLIENLKIHYKNELPFVGYRKPKDDKVFALLQEDKKLHIIKDFTETGFVFTAFDETAETIIIPFAHSEHLKCNYDISDILNTDVSDIEELSASDSKEKHISLVSQGIEAISNNEFEKVVLSRIDCVSNTENPIEIFTRLLSSYHNAFVYCWFHPKVGLWLGATPETLLKVENKTFETMSLAGTQKVDIENVQWSKKEKQEQKFVTEYIVNKLKPLTESLIVSDTKTVQAGHLVHIKSAISGSLKSNSLTNVIKALHPTPAVCGYPKESAKKFILENENYNREFYTGYLGELNIKQRVFRNRNKQNIENNAYASIKTVSNLFVNLRCMQLKNNEALIYVGGGITKDSNPEHEWLETVSKSATIKKVLFEF